MIRYRTAASLATILALGIVIAGILGPFGTGSIRFYMSDHIETQYIGGEIVTLFIAAPALLIAAVLWCRGSALAPELAFGPAMYTMYTFITVIMGQEYARFPGNAENAFFLYLALIATSFTLMIVAISQILALPTPDLPNGLRRALGITFLGIVGFFALMWIGQAFLVYRGEPPLEYLDSPSLFWLIKMLDLGFLLPAFALVGVGMLRRYPGPMAFAGGLAGYASCMMMAVLGMAIAMQVRGDPSASIGMLVVLGPVCAMVAFLTLRMLLLYRSRRLNGTSDVLTGASHAST